MKKLDLTKPVQTRSGHKVEILKTNLKGEFPVIGVVTHPDSGDEEVSYWHANGGFLHSGTYIHDLVNVPVKISRWYNVYSDGSTVDFETREAADDYATTQGKVFCRIACVQLTVTEGEGL